MFFNNPDTAILNEKKLFIFDMDGTIYLGGKPFDFAKIFNKIDSKIVGKCRHILVKPIFITNFRIEKMIFLTY